MKAMILAAGCGERMRPLTKDTPKVLLRVQGHALIDYHLHNLRKAGIHDVIINLHYLPEKITKYLGNGETYKMNIHYSHEETLLGLGGGVYHVLPFFDEKPFILVSGDMWTDYNYATLLDHKESIAHIVMVNNPDFHPEGDYGLEDGLILANSPRKLNYAGIGLFHPKLFAKGLPGTYGISPVLAPAIAEAKVTGEHYHGQWANLNTPEQLQQLDVALKNRNIKTKQQELP